MPRIDAVTACVIVYAGGTPAEAANWVEVGSATNGVGALVDTDSIIASKDNVEVRQRFPPARR